MECAHWMQLPSHSDAGTVLGAALFVVAAALVATQERFLQLAASLLGGAATVYGVARGPSWWPSCQSQLFGALVAGALAALLVSCVLRVGLVLVGGAIGVGLAHLALESIAVPVSDGVYYATLGSTGLVAGGATLARGTPFKRMLSAGLAGGCVAGGLFFVADPPPLVLLAVVVATAAVTLVGHAVHRHLRSDRSPP